MHAELRARRKTAKQFLAHYWYVARTIKGLTTDGPYVQDHLKHIHIVVPIYNEKEKIYKLPGAEVAPTKPKQTIEKKQKIKKGSQRKTLPGSSERKRRRPKTKK
jgi:hypothetical protein